MSIRDSTIGEFVDAVAARTPTPGGGAVASVIACLSAAIAQMVLNFSLGKKSLAEHGRLHETTLSSLKELTNRSLQLAAEDAAAYQRLNTLWKLDAADPVRVSEFPQAVEQAIAAPHAVLHTCMEILRALERICGTTNRMLDSDLAIAAVLAEAGVRAAAWNVRINLPLLDDAPVREALEQAVDSACNSACDLAARIERACTK